MRDSARLDRRHRTVRCRCQSRRSRPRCLSASLCQSERDAARSGDGGRRGDVHDRTFRLGGRRGCLPSFAAIFPLPHRSSNERRPPTSSGARRAVCRPTPRRNRRFRHRPRRTTRRQHNLHAGPSPLRCRSVIRRRRPHPSPVATRAHQPPRGTFLHTAIHIRRGPRPRHGRRVLFMFTSLGSPAMRRPMTSAAARSDCWRKWA